jgi:hypothetical protein
MITVDRKKEFEKPESYVSAADPELQNAGPLSYDLAALELWSHSKQKRSKGRVSGVEVYKYLEKEDLLKRCLTALDGEVIAKTVSVSDFLRIFGNSGVPLWGTVVELEGRKLRVSYLTVVGGAIKHFWTALKLDWKQEDKTPMHPL